MLLAWLLSNQRSLRYYEECGLLASDRSASCQRHYNEIAVDRVALIRQLLTERDRLNDEISQRVAIRDALNKIISTTPELDAGSDPRDGENLDH